MSQNDGGDNYSYDSERQRLLYEFAAALKARHKNPGSEPWFSEVDLVEIFDYAGDIGNDYLRAEVLMWGARTFPDSQQLLERRGVFYSDVLTDNDVEAFTSTNPDTVTFLTSVLKLRALNLGREGTLDELIRLLDKYDSLNDEETIQLVNLAADTGNLDWLMENLDMLREKAQFVPALLYEIGAESVERGKAAYGEKVFTELVEKEPYNADFWTSLGFAQIQLGNFGGATESADMAIAIDPSFIDAIQLKAQLLAKQSAPDPLSQLKEMTLTYPDNTSIAHSYLERMCADIRNFNDIPAEIISEAGRLLEKFPGDNTIINYYVALTPCELTVDYLDRKWKEWTPESGLQQWRDWAEFYLENRLYNGCLAVVRDILRNSDETDVILTPEREAETVICLMLRRWEETDQSAETFIATYNAPSQVVAIAQIYARMHLHRYSKAYQTFQLMEYCNRHHYFVTKQRSRLPILDPLIDMGVTLFLRNFSWSYFTRNPKKADKFDPLGLFPPM